jgi:hypothetical protein
MTRAEEKYIKYFDDDFNCPYVLKALKSLENEMQEENEQLRNELLQQQQLVRDLKCCGNCDRKENRGLCGYEDRCYSYIYIKQYLRPFFCDPVDLKEIEGYKDYWKPISY